MKQHIISRLLMIACFSFVFWEAKAQSCITHINYVSDRVGYLSQLNQSKIGSDYLIDRVVYDNNLLLSNGQSESLVNSPSAFFNGIESVLYSNQDTLVRKNNKMFLENHVAYFNGTGEYPIGISNYKFKRIKCNALTDGSFTQGENGLIENNTSSSSYEENRYFSVSPLTGMITGNIVKYYIGNMFYLSNLTNEFIEKIEIDFGNGTGYQTVSQNQSISVNYGSSSSYILIKAKVTVKDLSNSSTQILYSSSTVYRQAVSTIVQKRASANARISFDNITQPDIDTYFPSAVYRDKFLYYNCKGPNMPQCSVMIKELDLSMCKIKYSIIFSDQNQTSRKLRKPLIFCDGFDPDNKRNYFSTNYFKAPTLENDKDYRGLFHLINGDPSPWYSGSSSVGLIDKLLNLGYDIVVIDFQDGAGEINTNAHFVRRFFNEVLNSQTYRDNQTEESIFVGPSMGGLISRIAIKSMENAGENHHIKQWVSFDSPQQGAYIPISLQLGMDFFTKTNGSEFNNDAKAAIRSLNQPAALQMLTYHHSTSKSGFGAPNALFTPFYQNVNNLGFPDFTQNIAITNGGLGVLYNKSEEQFILALKSTPYTFIKGKQIGYNFILEGSRQGIGNDESFNLNYSIPFESAPGGWHSALYSANYNKFNEYRWDITFGWRYLIADKDHNKLIGLMNTNKDQIQKACFIPTISALGIKPTAGNVETTWNQVVARGKSNPNGLIVSPFDDIYGMQTNEEHVRISQSTGQYLQSKLLTYNKSVQKPYSNDRFNLTQNVSSSVKYKAYEYFTFCGVNNNKFILKNGADVVVESGISVTFNPGFSTETGAKLDVKINSTLINSQFARLNETSFVPEYHSKSPYLSENNLSENNFDETSSIQPNPSNGTFAINWIYDKFSIKIYDVKGQLVYSNIDYLNHKSLTLDNLTTGIYIVKLEFENNVSTQKLVIQK